MLGRGSNSTATYAPSFSTFNPDPDLAALLEYPAVEQPPPQNLPEQQIVPFQPMNVGQPARFTKSTFIWGPIFSSEV